MAKKIFCHNTHFLFLQVDVPAAYHITYSTDTPTKGVTASTHTTYMEAATHMSAAQGGGLETHCHTTTYEHDRVGRVSYSLTPCGEWAGGRVAQTEAHPAVRGAVCARNGACGTPQALRVVLGEAHARRGEEEWRHCPVPT